MSKKTADKNKPEPYSGKIKNKTDDSEFRSVVKDTCKTLVDAFSGKPVKLIKKFSKEF